MSLEFFGGFDQQEAMSAASLEQLRERMKAAAAQIKAIQREEKKQKRKEDELVKILLHFVQTSHKTELVLLISRCLELNIPANFILAMILLGNEEIQRATGRELPLLASGGATEGSGQALIFFNPQDESMPLKVKIEMDAWIKQILSAAEEVPQKIVKRCYKIDYVEKPREFQFDDPEYDTVRTVQPNLIQLMAVVMRDFLTQSGQEESFNKIQDFCEFILSGIINKIEDSLKDRKLLE